MLIHKNKYKNLEYGIIVYSKSTNNDLLKYFIKFFVKKNINTFKIFLKTIERGYLVRFTAFEKNY